MAEDNEKYVGKYKCVKSIDMENFMKELKLGWLKRKLANAFSITLEVSYDITSETWNFKTSSLVNKVDFKFKIGEEYEEKTPDGRDVLVTVTKEDDKFIQKAMAKNEGEKSTVAEREFKGDEVTVKFYCIGSDIFATQIYKKQISATNPPNPPNSTCTTSTIQKNAENKDPPTSNEAEVVSGHEFVSDILRS